MYALLSEIETARLLGIPTGTLRRWRAQGRCPTHVRLGRLVKYRPEDVSRFVERNARPAPETRQTA
jgi:excisionase family DNA binding protein